MNLLNSTRQLIQRWKTEGQSQRLGQFFVNYYIKNEDETTKNLFYMTDDQRAMIIIDRWMMDNNHFDAPPEPVREITKHV